MILLIQSTIMIHPARLFPKLNPEHKYLPLVTARTSKKKSGNMVTMLCSNSLEFIDQANAQCSILREQLLKKSPIIYTLRGHGWSDKEGQILPVWPVSSPRACLLGFVPPLSVQLL